MTNTPAASTTSSQATSNQPFVFQAEPSGNTAGFGRLDAAPLQATASVYQQTQREISEIVREIAAASRSSIDPQRYWTLFCDRVLRVMAAEGVAIHQCEDARKFVTVCRLGPHSGASMSPSQTAVHQTLLREVIDDRQPVVVPPTPDASDDSMPANPASIPVAMAPVSVAPHDQGDRSGDHLVEVFLEDDAGEATMRGYLRFVAQMADLAGEYLRAQQLRTLKAAQTASEQVDQATQAMSSLTHPQSVYEHLVDTAAEIFGFDRVAYVRNDVRHGASDVLVAAVSHVDQIDQRSGAVASIVKQAISVTGSDPIFAPGLALPTSDSGAAVGEVAELTLVASIPCGSGECDRLLAYSVDNEFLLQPPLQSACVRLTRQATSVAHHLNTVRGIPGGRIWAALSTRQHSVRTGLRRHAMPGILAIVFVVALAMVPFPLTVVGRATISPNQMQSVSVARIARVAKSLVAHGDRVTKGDPLLVLQSDDLNRQITVLEGELAVLTQKLAGLTGTQIDDRQQRNEWVTRRREVELQRDGVQRRLDLRQQQRSELTVYANCDGKVDLWKHRDRLVGRTVSPGEEVLRVIRDQSDWSAQATVAQSRLEHLHRSNRSGTLAAFLTPVAEPDVKIPATLDFFGPGKTDEAGSALSVVSVNLARQQTDALTLHDGQPATVVFRCGSQPLGYVLFQDAINWVRQNIHRIRLGTFQSADAK